MKILLFGCNGQVGWEAQRSLACLGEVVALDQGQVDFLHPELFKDIITDTKPNVIVNAAAYTAVDQAESEPGMVRMINAIAPGELAELARQFNSTFIHFSTDYVYDGTKGASYTEMDNPNPLNVYGQTKLQGDQAVQQAGGAYLILRTSWVYSLRGEGFVRKVLSWARRPGDLRVVADQVGSPTWARLLAEVTAGVIVLGRKNLGDWMKQNAGVYHVAGDGQTSRFGWAEEILKNDPDRKEHQYDHLVPANSYEFPTPATRPAATPLDCKKLCAVFGMEMPSWTGTLLLAMEPG